MPGDHGERHGRNRPARQPDQRRQRHHRGADHPDHAPDKCVAEREIEAPGEPHDGELDQYEPQPARKQKAARLGDASTAPIEEGREPGKKDEGRRAKMGDPSGEEQRGLGHVARIEAPCSEEIARVVERHQRHNEAAEEIDRRDPRSVVPRDRTFRGCNLRSAVPKLGRWVHSASDQGHYPKAMSGEFPWRNDECHGA